MLSTPVPQQQPPYYGHYTGQPALAGTSSYELEDFVGANFYYLHSLADGNQHIQIRGRCWSSQQCYLHCLCTLSTPVDRENSLKVIISQRVDFFQIMAHLDCHQ